MKTLFQPLARMVAKGYQLIGQKFIALTKPAKNSLLVGAAFDLTKSKPDLIAENALLRQQLLVLNRQVKSPKFKPDTLLGWHRQGFRLLWKFKSKAKSRQPRIGAEIIALIKQMASEKPHWGDERIRGEILKLDIKVVKRTIQKYMRQAKPARPPSQNWSRVGYMVHPDEPCSPHEGTKLVKSN